VIDLSHYDWSGKDTWEADHQQRISGGYIKNGKLYVRLKNASDIKRGKILPPSGSEQNYRLVIDLFNKKVQKAEAPPQKAPEAMKAISPPAPVPATTPAPAPVPAAQSAPAPAVQPAAAPPQTTGDDFP
jgi:hypothetical protein